MAEPLVPAVFLDKDGTLIENIPYNVDPARIRLAPGAGAALRRLRAAGYRLFVVSNQSGVARGYFGVEALEGVERRLRELLRGEGVEIDGVRWCPHHPRGTVAAYTRACDCRKPAPGLILSLAAEHGIDLARSWMVGDTPADVEAGRRAGCRTVLLAPTGEEAESGVAGAPDHVATDWIDAVEWILAAGFAAG